MWTYTNIDNRRQIRENIQQISQRVDNLNNPIQILRNQNRNANQELEQDYLDYQLAEIFVEYFL